MKKKKVKKLIADLYEYFCEHPMQMPQAICTFCMTKG